ncbi:long-chain acyl-CoA synthetase [Candidatus Pelagibacter ubique]|uniref:Long-chain acyl-CoA synthetase n=1 Tax=Pelagibacter ubique TaxID=198252 RepID=A0ABX1T2C2_PELUQ|nr:long-chain fatty acid--CoA ligase [Candidatus Pelagibacter ubique]NMN67214.1 long-chain acyl-CoA synthetase [Candidatus Pelagibacter ubique]
MKIDKINNLLELFYQQYEKQNKEDVFLQSLKDIEKKYTWSDVYKNIMKLSEEISKYINKGDRCLLISENRPEWMIADLSIMLSRGTTVPAYTTYVERDYDYIIDDCTPSIIIVSNQAQYEKIKNIILKKDFIKKIIVFEKIKDFDNDFILNTENIFKKVNYYKKDLMSLNIIRQDIACIIYTSGTQGKPKGVMLSHGGILNNCEGSYNLLKKFISNNPKFLTWLPLSHSYEHTVQFVQIVVGAKVNYAESIDKLIKNMEDCSPEIMTAVPRFYQNLYQKINASFNKVTGIKKILINQTVRLGKKKLNKKNLSLIENLMNFICEKLIRKKIKNQFGGKLKAFISGGGALDQEVGSFLNAIGLPTLQGYGLTETSPVVSCNPIDDIRVQTVGPPFKGNLVKIADDGEILVKGENVMMGYWKKEKETNEVLKNGWLFTGDVGEFDGEFLKITDRKKDIIITPGGDNISPIKIENDLNKSDYIEQSLVYGDNKQYLICLIVLSGEKVNTSEEEIRKEIEKINKNLSKIEKIKKFLIIKDQFTIENGLMTPTLKLKRYKIINNYKSEIEKLY